MARGTSLKNKRLTIRMTDELYDKLDREAKKNSNNISDYFREKLESDNQNTEILSQICNLLTAWNRILNKYDIAQEDKELIDREVRLVWQHLR